MNGVGNNQTGVLRVRVRVRVRVRNPLTILANFIVVIGLYDLESSVRKYGILIF